MMDLWRGNIRELEHTTEHAFVVCRDSVIDLAHVPTQFQTPPTQRETPAETAEERQEKDEKSRCPVS